jgi:hypothetical protein
MAIGFPALSQPRKMDFYFVDYHALTVEASTVKELADKLTRGYPTAIEKTRAIFRWMTGKISYRTTFKNVEAPEENDTAALKPLSERVAESVLRNRQALCDGYSRLFKTLCDYASIQCEVIYGYARTETHKQIQRFGSNHAWNAVYLDSNWYLLDVTWASGFIDSRTEQYVQHLDEQYFLTTPDNFIREHYPDDLSWTLMDDPPLMPEFRQSPFRQRAFAKYNIRRYAPSTGLINAKVGDTLHFEITSADRLRDGNISPNPFLDQSLYHSSKTALIKPVSSKGNSIKYEYRVIAPSIQWIYLLYNEDLVLRYRVNVRKGEAIPMLAAMD